MNGFRNKDILPNSTSFTFVFISFFLCTFRYGALCVCFCFLVVRAAYEQCKILACRDRIRPPNALWRNFSKHAFVP